MRILFLSAWYPFPPNNGSKLRIYHLLRGLSQAHKVTLLTFTDRSGASVGPDNDLGIDVQTVPQRVYRPTSLRAIAGLLNPTPRVFVDTYAPQMASLIREELRQRPYDLVVASQWSTAAYAPIFRTVPALFEELELGIFEAKKAHASKLLRLRHELTIAKLRFYLRRLLGYFQSCSVVSQVERSLVRQLAPNYQPVEVIPNCVNLADYRDIHVSPQPETLVFSGSLSYFANHDAMIWFLRKVYPQVQAQVPNVKLIITGNHANLPLPPAHNVTLTGFVDDPRPLMASATVSLAPIRLGGGTRLKILEAMALGTPVVATPKGAEGLALRNGEHLLMGDTPEAFAAAVIRLLRDPVLRRQVALNALHTLTQEYDWSVVMPRFLQLVDRVAQT